jgi:Family of unknown function (DUF5706)
MNYPELFQKAEDHVNLFYRDHTAENFFYHNQSHAKQVLDNTKKIADHCQLDDRLYFIVCTAACFHDLGYLIKNERPHEEKSVELAKIFLNANGVDEADIVAIEQCIMATQMPQLPGSLVEKIICDADLYNLGTPAFRENNKLLKKEIEALGNSKVDGIAWRASTIKMLENHTYHTEYCRLLLNKTKAENLDRIKNKQEEKLNKIQQVASVENGSVENSVAITGLSKNKKEAGSKKKKGPVKGIETMFRISASKNIRISEMADKKANIMISVNSIIISVVLGVMVHSLAENKNLIIPTIILLAVNVTTIIYSVLATRPKIPDGRFTQEDVDNKSVNLLYFGSFYNMNFKQYDDGLNAMMADSEFLYGTLSKDTFWQGKVLGRKYKLLRMSYTIFLYGIVTAVVAFTVAVIFF